MAGAVDGTYWNTGCDHYKRFCRFLAPCCNNLYPCHVCHDENEGHAIDRYKIKQHLCLNCKELQEVDVNCSNCGIEFAKYACVLCYIFDNQLKGQFHCPDCRLCRVGGRENYFHCKTCGMCFAVGLHHKCIKNIARGNCPLCKENLHDTRAELQVLSCGHMIHTKCFEELKKGENFKNCLVCNKE